MDTQSIMMRKLALLGGSIFALATAAPALAQQTDAAGQTGAEAGKAASSGGEEDIVVTGRLEFFRPIEARSALKLNLAILDTPLSVSVINEDLFEIVNSADIRDFYRFIPGTTATNVEPLSPVTFVRGFEISIIRGYKVNDGASIGGVQFDPISLERVEFVRGAAGATFGSNNYGGIVNTILKKPGGETGASIQAGIGNAGYRRLAADINVPIIGDDRLAVRLTSGYEGQTFNGSTVNDQHRFAITPYIRAKLADNLTLDLFGMYKSNSGEFGTGFVPLYNPTTGTFGYQETLEFADQGTFYGNSELNDLRQTQLFAGSHLKYDINDNHSISLRYSYAKTKNKNQDIQIYDEFVEDLSEVDVWAWQFSNQVKATAVEATYSGSFNAFGREQKFIVIADRFTSTISESDWIFDFVGTTSVANPQYNQLTYPFPPYPNQLNEIAQAVYTGVAAQAVLSFSEQLSAVLGLRHEWASVNRGENEDQQWTPMVALTYKPRPNLTLYGSYTQGFVPQPGRFRQDGTERRPIGAETGTQYEVGFKSEFLDRQLGVNISLFRIDRGNVATFGAFEDGFQFFLNGRSQRHQGFELEAVGRVLPGFSIIANYAYLDTDIRQDLNNPDNIGNQSFRAPRHRANLYLSYEILKGPLDGLFFGGGASHTGSYFSNDANTFRLAPVTLFDANIGYEAANGLRLSLTGSNLFNAKYLDSFPGNASPVYISFGARRSVRATATYSF